MSARRAAPRPASPSASEGSTRALSVPASRTRLGALEAEHAALLKKIAKVRTATDKLVASMHETVSVMQTRLGPLIDEMLQLQRELHDLFLELLVKGRLGRTAHREVEHLYRMLHDEEFLDPLPDDGDEGVAGEDAPDPEWAEIDWDATDIPREHASSGPEKAHHPSLAEELRAVFRRLARALHPDTAQDPAEQARRTEAMKEITQAHGAGDLARLLELERVWLESAPAAPDDGVDDTERRCAALVATNDALRRQLRQLERELTSMRTSDEVRTMKDLMGSRRGRKRATPEDLVKDTEAERDHYREVRDLVRNFRDGKATLAELLAGPASLTGTVDDLLDEDIPDELRELLEAMHGVAAAKPKKRRTAKRK